jgi:hypothetical protein
MFLDVLFQTLQTAKSPFALAAEIGAEHLAAALLTMAVP